MLRCLRDWASFCVFFPPSVALWISSPYFSPLSHKIAAVLAIIIIAFQMRRSGKDTREKALSSRGLLPFILEASLGISTHISLTRIVAHAPPTCPTLHNPSPANKREWEMENFVFFSLLSRERQRERWLWVTSGESVPQNWPHMTMLQRKIPAYSHLVF